MKQIEVVTLEGENTSKLQELKEQLNKDLLKTNSVFEKNLLKAEYEHRLKLLGLREEITITESEQKEDDFECVGCGS